jgi:A/G-specific adenine glycosylase
MGAPSATIAQRVIEWQRTHGRHALPWQRTRDPYRIWLSEIMLQQTQVSTVLAYYERFLQRFPDVRALAAAPLDDVLAAWSGLGYYSRARHLHRCAQTLVQRHGGAFPRTSVELAALPGIGRSTAAAIAAFAFGERAAILDGNVKRVLTRALGFGHDLASGAQERALWAHAESLLPDEGIEAYTQGLMDLGAGVCLQRRPQCLLCPLQPVCVASHEGQPERYPVKTRRLQRGRRDNALLWLQAGERLWLSQRPATGVWAGLWSLPEFANEDELQSLTVSWRGRSEALPAIEHVLTHFDWTLRPLRYALAGDTNSGEFQLIESALPAGRWVAREEALGMGLPAPVRKLLSRE